MTEYEKTIPWHKDEYLLVDGYECVYWQPTNKELVVHLPGMRSATMAQLMREKRKVELPARWRT